MTRSSRAVRIMIALEALARVGIVLVGIGIVVAFVLAIDSGS